MTKTEKIFKEIRGEDKLIIGIYNKGVLLPFRNVNDDFPKGLNHIKIDIRWKTHYHAWYKTDYKLHNFYSTPLERVLHYPNTFYELFCVLECILYEHLIMGTIGMDDESGEWCPLADKGENDMLGIVRDIINGYEEKVENLPIYQS